MQHCAIPLRTGHKRSKMENQGTSIALQIAPTSGYYHNEVKYLDAKIDQLDDFIDKVKDLSERDAKRLCEKLLKTYPSLEFKRRVLLQENAKRKAEVILQEIANPLWNQRSILQTAMMIQATVPDNISEDIGIDGEPSICQQAREISELIKIAKKNDATA